MANDAINTQNWAKSYQLYPPAFREICSVGDYVNRAQVTYEKEFGTLKQFLGAGMEPTVF
jgi:hypothetical protein